MDTTARRVGSEPNERGTGATQSSDPLLGTLQHVDVGLTNPPSPAATTTPGLADDKAAPTRMNPMNPGGPAESADPAELRQSIGLPADAVDVALYLDGLMTLQTAVRRSAEGTFPRLFNPRRGHYLVSLADLREWCSGQWVSGQKAAPGVQRVDVEADGLARPQIGQRSA